MGAANAAAAAVVELPNQEAQQQRHTPVATPTAHGSHGASAVANLLAGNQNQEDPLIGQLLADKYLIDRKLGEGGMGAVYLVQHTLLEKSLALKVLHGEYARKPDLVQRFMQEARAASKIRHENRLVRVMELQIPIGHDQFHC